MTERTGEFRMSNIGIMKNYKLHRYPNAIRKSEIKEQFISHKYIWGWQVKIVRLIVTIPELARPRWK
jgi:hypothetical protein